MNKLIPLLLISILFICDVEGQMMYRKLSDKTVELLKEGSGYYHKGEYQKSAEAYSKAFTIENGNVASSHKYNAACSWARAGNTDSAINLLYEITVKGYFNQYNRLVADTDLEVLHTNKLWPAICDAANKNRRAKMTDINEHVMSTLDTIIQHDQQFRWRYMDTAKKYGPKSLKLKKMEREMVISDSLHFIKVAKILNKYGWLSSDEIGPEGAKTMFLVIQHSNIDSQQKYLPYIKDAVAEGKLEKKYVAFLEDRIAIGSGKAQVYGSQIGRYSNSTKRFVYPIVDVEDLDKRRALIGLGPMKQYAIPYRIDWSLEYYYEELEKVNDELSKRAKSKK